VVRHHRDEPIVPSAPGLDEHREEPDAGGDEFGDEPPAEVGRDAEFVVPVEGGLVGGAESLADPVGVMPAAGSGPGGSPGRCCPPVEAGRGTRGVEPRDGRCSDLEPIDLLRSSEGIESRRRAGRDRPRVVRGEGPRGLGSGLDDGDGPVNIRRT